MPKINWNEPQFQISASSGGTALLTLLEHDGQTVLRFEDGYKIDDKGHKVPTQPMGKDLLETFAELLEAEMGPRPPE